VGTFLSTDIVSVEQASIDNIKVEDFIRDSLPAPFDVKDGDGHLLERIHNKNPYLQVEEAAKLGLGELHYELVEID